MEIKDVKVELKRHRGTQNTKVGKVKVDLPQQVIFVNGKWAGYAPDAPGSHISIILPNLPEAMLAHIKSEVDRLRGTKSPAIVQAKQMEESDVELVREEAPADKSESLT